MLLKSNYEIYSLIGYNIKKYRKKQKITQYELAKKLLLEATVSVIEKDRLRLFIEDESLKKELNQ